MMPIPHTREVVRLRDLFPIDGPDVIDGHEFYDCHILGPAVLFLLDFITIVGCSFPSPDVFWPVETDRQYFGVIAIKHCVFKTCRFERVGIAAPRDFINKIKTDGFENA
jgi:hypothetical protein